MMLMFVLPAAPPPPISVGADVRKMLEMPRPGVLPRPLPRNRTHAPFSLARLASVSCAPCAPPGETVKMPCPPSTVTAPRDSELPAEALPSSDTPAPYRVVGTAGRRSPRFTPVLSSTIVPPLLIALVLSTEPLRRKNTLPARRDDWSAVPNDWKFEAPE